MDRKDQDRRAKAAEEAYEASPRRSWEPPAPRPNVVTIDGDQYLRARSIEGGIIATISATEIAAAGEAMRKEMQGEAGVQNRAMREDMVEIVRSIQGAYGEVEMPALVALVLRLAGRWV